MPNSCAWNWIGSKPRFKRWWNRASIARTPNVLSSQIEGVTASVQSTEAAIRELQQITGVVDQMQEPPAILDADWRKVAQ